jgi:hypothetical protein
MTEEHIWIYLLVVPIICLLLGYAVGYKYGWQTRDNKAKKDRLKQMLEEIQGKVDDISSLKEDAQTFSSIPFFDFNIIGIRKKEEPLTLQQQLEKALEEEDYEKAAQIRNQLKNENEK